MYTEFDWACLQLALKESSPIMLALPVEMKLSRLGQPHALT